ncbi:MAG: SLATT domain-containing protein [Proteobacteria bacterium]|nr:SLATT domain-containing protein [Pseudomonadota bacterium]
MNPSSDSRGGDADLPVEIAHEIRRIEENALYNAQAHFEVAAAKSKTTKWMLVGCSAVAGVAGLLVAVGLPGWIGAVTVVANAISGVAAAFGVQEASGRHDAAGRQWTQLRHDARALRCITGPQYARDVLIAEIGSLATRYSDLNAVLPSTDNEAFERARERIQAGRFEPDFESAPAGPPVTARVQPMEASESESAEVLAAAEDSRAREKNRT